jgi:hypothetical protein
MNCITLEEKVSYERKTSFTPRNLQSRRETTNLITVNFPNDFDILHSDMLRTTRELNLPYIIGFNTSVKRVSKNVNNFHYVHFSEKEEIDQLYVKGAISEFDHLLKSNKIDTSILFIFRTIEKWMTNMESNRVVFFLDLVKKYEFNEDIFIAILSSTLSWKNRINNRSEFYNITCEKLLLNYDNNYNEVTNILSGLK